MLCRRVLFLPILVLCANLPLCTAGEVIDSAKAVAEEGTDTLWYDLKLLDVEGRGWTETKAFYDRLPAKAEGVVREPVWNLSRQSAGLCTRFVTDATAIQARWTLTSGQLAMPHMPATGVSGLDLYVKSDGRWRWLAVGFPKEQTTRVALVSGLPAGEREYLLYLPLYNGVSSVELGLQKGLKLAKADPYGAGQRKPIVFYGTSITQGGCASRPGMVHTAILQRRLGYSSDQSRFLRKRPHGTRNGDALRRARPGGLRTRLPPQHVGGRGHRARRAVRDRAPQGPSGHADSPGRRPQLHRFVSRRQQADSAISTAGPH